MRTKLLALLAALLVCASGGPLRAANLLINGSFETVVYTSDGTTPYPYSTVLSGANTDASLPGWNSLGGYNFVLLGSGSGSGGTTTAHNNIPRAYESPTGGNFALWGPNNGSNNGFANSLDGGNFLAADGAFYNRPIFQTVSGLTAGRQYAVNFEWAAAQQRDFDGITTERWSICFGTCSFTSNFDANGHGYSSFDSLGNSTILDLSTPATGDFVPLSQIYTTSTVTNSNHGFVPWRSEYVVFTATSSTQTLSLLAYGTPIGQPPFSLIDGVSLDAVPEPTTWAMMLIGFGVIGGVMRTRRPPLTGRRALNAQIV